MQKQNMLNGINVSQKSIRYYPEGEFASNIIGYIGPIDDNQKERYQQEGYNIAYDVIGRAGVEAVFESNLRGNHGSNVIKVDNNGVKKQEIFEKESKPGDNIYLTIDKDLQKVAERALSDVMIGLQKTGIIMEQDLIRAMQLEEQQLLWMLIMVIFYHWCHCQIMILMSLFQKIT